MHASLNVGYQGKSGPGKIHEVILVLQTFNCRILRTFNGRTLRTFSRILRTFNRRILQIFNGRIFTNISQLHLMNI